MCYCRPEVVRTPFCPQCAPNLIIHNQGLRATIERLNEEVKAVLVQHDVWMNDAKKLAEYNRLLLAVAKKSEIIEELLDADEGDTEHPDFPNHNIRLLEARRRYINALNSAKAGGAMP